MKLDIELQKKIDDYFDKISQSELEGLLTNIYNVAIIEEKSEIDKQ